MSKVRENVSGIVGIAFVAISILIALLVYIGGSAAPILNAAGEEMTVPKFTDGLLIWTVFLFGLAIIITVVLSMVQFGKTLAQGTKQAMKSILPLVGFALIFVIAWNLGTGEHMTIIGYEGTGNEGAWAQFSDMIIISTYSLFGLVIVSIIGSKIYTSLK